MDELRLNFVDFWPNFVKDDNYFYHLLAQEYKLIIDEDSPDILFHSVDYAKKQEHRRYDNGKTIKIFYTGECVRPDFNVSHFAFTFDYSTNPKEYRLPLWALTLNWFNIAHNDDRDISYLHDVDAMLKPKDAEYIRDHKHKFCSFIASAPRGRRCEFVPKLLKHRSIDCAGRLFNNMEPIRGRGDQRYKIEFLNDYKFNISFENESYHGYVTEKIVHSMYSNCIPVYWGCHNIQNDFNPKSFINANNLSDSDLIDTIIRYDNDDDLYMEMLTQPWFNDNQVPSNVLPENVLGFIKKALA